MILILLHGIAAAQTLRADVLRCNGIIRRKQSEKLPTKTYSCFFMWVNKTMIKGKHHKFEYNEYL